VICGPPARSTARRARPCAVRSAFGKAVAISSRRRTPLRERA
jgi:hypothetical protein